jgi:hypothetical protein
LTKWKRGTSICKSVNRPTSMEHGAKSLAQNKTAPFNFLYRKRPLAKIGKKISPNLLDFKSI